MNDHSLRNADDDGGGGSSIRSRRSRPHGAIGDSRNSSARSSAAYNDDVYQQGASQPQQGYGSLGLRSTSSRFSLNEQFASTRREIEFDYDDASSVVDRSTIYSQPIDELAQDGTLEADVGDEHTVDSPVDSTDPYDLLCISRHPTAQDIRRAYLRLVTLLHPESQPPLQRRRAEPYFAAIQDAYEALSDPCRRLKYDLDYLDGRHTKAGAGNHPRYDEYRRWHAQFLRHSGLQSGLGDDCSTWELGTRFDAQQIFHRSRRGSQDNGFVFKPVDFEVNHFLSINLPRTDKHLRHAKEAIRESWAAFFTLRDAPNSMSKDVGKEDRLHGTPNGTVLRLRGSIYGLFQDFTSLPFIVLMDHYQPSFPSPLMREKSVHLYDGRVQPTISISLRHSLTPPSPETSLLTAPQLARGGQADECDTVVEVESDIIPEPAVAARFSGRFRLPYDQQPTLVQLGAKSPLWAQRHPRLWASLQRSVGGGMFSCAVDSGDWHGSPGLGAVENCRFFFSGSSRLHHRNFPGLDWPLLRPPRVELAYKVGGGSVFGTIDRGIRGFDVGFDVDESPSWTLSTTAEPSYQATSLRYARDVAVLGATPPSSPPARLLARRVRFEAEVSANSFWAGYLAVRCLKRVGRFSKAGFELGFSSYFLHLSLYWSRLGRRINLPFLVCSRNNQSARLLFWTTVIPCAGLAAAELWDRWRRRCRVRKRDLAAAEDTARAERRRGDADQLAALLYTGVQNRQRSEYLGSGLVILSAKYGLKGSNMVADWAAEEIADVTVAVAALVEDGRLHIPAGVNKSNILGFWDPAPGREKVLHVRYTYKGKEATIDVQGDEQALVLPPVEG
ncbi:hypothetical protein F4780DRAFT_773475 [Xylariomycetidae sp. FL0641]|nr:hypothetical protein F4780DRAFT_773475 [Xylariomycetidae sp. FL0641]